MSNDFFQLTQEIQSALIKRAGDQFAVSDIIIEKDLWVCWVLEQLFLLPIPMVFKGGTSLSKVFGLIKRFSEDCDITIDYRHFEEKINFQKITRSQLKKISNQLKVQLKKYVSEIILPYLTEQALKVFSNDQFNIILSEDGEKLNFSYPSVINTAQNYLRDHVLIEFGIRNSIEPCEQHQIKPYLAEVTLIDTRLPTPQINTLSPMRTYWEKVTLIHVECHRDKLTESPERLSRHWYDLFMLNHSWVGEKAILNNEILKSVIQYKKAFFNSGYANYDDCLDGKLVLIPTEEKQKNLKKDFKRMIDADMFHGSPPKFEEILTALKSLEEKINRN